MTTTYTCKKCDSPAKIKDGEVERSCGCNDSIIANLKASATGQSSMGNRA